MMDASQVSQSALFDSHSDFLKAPIAVAVSQSAGGSSQELMLAVLGSFLAWTDAYFILHALNRKRSPEWNCRLITTVHAIIATGLCFTSAVITGPWPFTYIGEPSTSLHNTIGIISLGYFLFDFAWCLLMRTEGPVMLAHHVVSIFAITYTLKQNRFGSELAAVMGASEFTNPLLQLRWFLKQTGRYKGRTAKCIDFLFVLFFLGARLGIGSVFHFICQTSPKVDLITKAGGQAFYIISVVFGVQLMVMMYKKYLRKRPRK